MNNNASPIFIILQNIKPKIGTFFMVSGIVGFILLYLGLKLIPFALMFLCLVLIIIYYALYYFYRIKDRNKSYMDKIYD